MIYKSSAIVYLFILVITPLFFGDVFYKEFLAISGCVQRLCLLFCIFSYVINPNNKKGNVLILLGFVDFYGYATDILMHNINAIYYFIESLIFFSFGMHVMLHADIKTAKTIDHDNILLAFYKGKKGSLIMRFFSLFGFPVKSMCILAGDKALYLKANNPKFVFGDSAAIHRKSENYVIIDTGVKYTGEFIYRMKKHKNIIAKKGMFRVRCIEAISDLLEMIGSEWKPKTYIPSLYLRRVA